MKKNLILSVCLLGISLTASAQFKIHSNGFMSFKKTQQPHSPISLAEGGGSTEYPFFMSYKGDYCGIHFYANEASGTNDRSYAGILRCGGDEEEINIGLNGLAYSSSVSSPSGNPAAVGLWGCGYSNTQGRYAYGVLGQSFGSYNSAAVCGIATNNNLTSIIPDDQYAGLFVGKTKVVGTLTATGGLYNTTLYNCPIGSGRNETTPIADDGMTTSLFQGLTTIAYHNPQEVCDGSPRPTFLDPDSITIAEMEKHGIDISKLDEGNEDVIYRQILEKQHYALSADELERVFPNLVYTDKDGGKAINYVEMVPLLVQCINELNARLSALDGTGAGNVGAGPVPARDDMATARASQNNVSAIDGTPSKTQAVLY